MESDKKKLPIGIDRFEELRQNDFYYIDKTGLIIDLLRSWGKVNLFTRPRRFGKSLNISMLESFFSPNTDKSIFDGLAIAKEEALCGEYMGRCPVVSITLKDIDAPDYEQAAALTRQVIRDAARKVCAQLEGEKSRRDIDWDSLNRLCGFEATEADLVGSLYVMTEALEKHYGRSAILLIDEYDVPLAKAHEQGYYDKMLSLLRGMFHRGLKSNPSLKFAVMTGCMRISKESIFTGLNNLRVLSILDDQFDEYYGFTDREVRDLLAYYELGEFYEVIRDWYDGYRFGGQSVYCPWDVISYCDKLRSNRERKPENFWINSSSNYAVRRFISYSGDRSVREELEKLINGEAVEKKVRMELTYQDMYDSIDNLWSVLFMTGYLTLSEKIDERRLRLVIPNQEIRTIFTEQIMAFFEESVKNDGGTLGCFCSALESGDAAGVEKQFGNYLRSTISIRDTSVQKPMKESFYHGILVGILGVKENWSVSSNREAGDGYCDLMITTDRQDTAILIEVKYAEGGRLDAACREALEQMESRHYAEDLYYEGYDHVLKYGIACYKKRCRVMLSDSSDSE